MFVSTRQSLTLPNRRIRPTMLSTPKLRLTSQKITITVSVSLLMALTDDLLRSLKQN